MNTHSKNKQDNFNEDNTTKDGQKFNKLFVKEINENADLANAFDDFLVSAISYFSLHVYWTFGIGTRSVFSSFQFVLCNCAEWTRRYGRLKLVIQYKNISCNSVDCLHHFTSLAMTNRNLKVELEEKLIANTQTNDKT